LLAGVCWYIGSAGPAREEQAELEDPGRNQEQPAYSGAQRGFREVTKG